MQDIKDKIIRLKKERDAVILAHYYVPGEVQDIADYIGDSYYLSKIAAKAQENIIVFCGVYFMGESAKILNPSKMVLMPDLGADCPMAHMATVSGIEKVRKAHPEAAVVCYINSTAEIKAHSDVCVTSSNAVQVIKALPEPVIYFIPDSNLGRYVAGRLPEKQFIFNDGHCHVHTDIRRKDVIERRQEHPLAKIAAHPECRAEVLELADYIGSTSGIIDYVDHTDAKDFIICTETGVFHEILNRAQGKNLFSAKKEQVCPDMKKNTLLKVLQALETLEPEVQVDESILKKARLPLDRMLQLSGMKSDE
jgi:quinolinate synthase